MRSLLLLISIACTAQQWPAIRWEPWISGLEAPTDIQSPNDGSGRLFVLEQTGRVRVIQDGQLLASPVLDITSKVQFSGEMGLLGIAFPPNFAAKQYFYVNYVDRQTRTNISRFRIAGNTVNPNSEQVLLTVQQPYPNHKGGQLAFGPDGYLYIGLGDGGSANDPQKNGQNRNVLLGKMLRIDTESGAQPYAIPSTNPFRGGAGRPEIWAYGLRNPWRFSFDRTTGELYIADVGQSTREEIDVQPAASPGGENYGWSEMEGSVCKDDSNCASRNDLTRPVWDYDRNAGMSITGGYVYRGREYSALTGIYIYGDFVSGRTWGLRRSGTTWENRELPADHFSVSTYGQDEHGELYAADYESGRILRLTAAASAFTVTGVVNGASFQPGLAPGGIGTAFLTALPGVTGTVAATQYPLPESLSGVSVRLNDAAAPLFAVANPGGAGQINFQVPFEASGEMTLSVTAGGSTSQITTTVNAAAPGLFTLDGINAVALVGSDNTVVTANNPIPKGGIAILYATGLGPVSNPPATGEAAPNDPLAYASATTEVTVGGHPAEVLYSGLAPGFAGLYQVNVRLAADTPSGSSELILRANGVATPPARLPVQ